MPHDILKRALLGAAAGVAGTVVLQQVMKAAGSAAPQSTPPLRHDPGEFMLVQAKRALPPRVRRHVPAAAGSAAQLSLHLGYGAAFGMLYALLRPAARSAGLPAGAALGLAAWATGYLGWLPAAGLMPPIWKHTAAQTIAPVAEHAAYGIATVKTYQLLERLAH